MSSKSTADGWYFVSTGTGGIISVLRANLMVTFLLQGEGNAIRFIRKERKKEKKEWEREREHTQMYPIQI